MQGKERGFKDDSSVFGLSGKRLELPLTELGKSRGGSKFGIMSPLG